MTFSTTNPLCSPNPSSPYFLFDYLRFYQPILFASSFILLLHPFVTFVLLPDSFHFEPAFDLDHASIRIEMHPLFIFTLRIWYMILADYMSIRHLYRRLEWMYRKVLIAVDQVIRVVVKRHQSLANLRKGKLYIFRPIRNANDAGRRVGRARRASPDFASATWTIAWGWSSATPGGGGNIPSFFA